MTQSYDTDVDPTQPKDPRSLGEIVGDITTDLSTLVKQELEMAKTELRQEATTAGRGVGMLAAAGLAALLLLIFASLALTWLLDNWLPVEAAALIVAALWAIVAGALSSAGRKDQHEKADQRCAGQHADAAAGGGGLVAQLGLGELELLLDQRRQIVADVSDDLSQAARILGLRRIGQPRSVGVVTLGHQCAPAGRPRSGSRPLAVAPPTGPSSYGATGAAPDGE